MGCSPCRSYIVGVMATLGFMLISGFEAGLAIGHALQHPHNNNNAVPTYLRVASGISSVLWLYAAAIVLHRSGLINLGLSPEYTKGATYGLAASMIFGALLVWFSPFSVDRWTWGPLTIGLAILCLVLARVEDEDEDLSGNNSGNAVVESLREPLLVMAIV